MPTDRRFCRFTRSAEEHPFGLRWDQRGGFCISAFLLLNEPGHPTSVLVGRIDPTGPWDHLEGLSPERIAAHEGGWHLPASHLLLREGPEEAAARIAREMLGGATPSLGAPQVISEVYAPRRFPEMPNHWDLSFLYRGTLSPPAPSVPGVWRELRFVDVRSAAASDFARAHEEVLARAGVPVGRP